MKETVTRKTVNVAMIGAGSIAVEHAKAWALAPVISPTIAATPVRKIICDINGSLAEQRALEWGFEEWTDDYKEAINRDDIDIVDICTPPFNHVELCIEAMKAGKFVLCEKPLTTTVEDCEKILDAATKYNGRTGTAFCKRRWPAAGYARKMIKDGAIGKPLIYNGRYCLGGGKMAGGWYSFRSTWQLSGGFADSTSHILDMCRYILDDSYDEIVASIDNFVDTSYEYPKDGGAPIAHPRNAEDMALIMANMKSGAHATIYRTSFYYHSGENMTFEVIGEDGVIRWSANRPSEVQITRREEPADESGFRTVILGKKHQYGDDMSFMAANNGIGLVDQFSFQAVECVNACVNGTKFDPDFFDTYEIVKVCDAARESQKTKSWIKI